MAYHNGGNSHGTGKHDFGHDYPDLASSNYGSVQETALSNGRFQSKDSWHSHSAVPSFDENTYGHGSRDIISPLPKLHSALLNHHEIRKICNLERRSTRRPRDTYHMLQRLRFQCDVYRKYRDNASKSDTSRSRNESPWPEKREEAFWEGVALYKPKGRTKNRLTIGGKNLGRNEMIAEHMKFRLGSDCFDCDMIHDKKQQEPRKIVSSHLQVLKKHFRVEADMTIWVDREDWVDHDTRQQKIEKRTVLYWLGFYHDDKKDKTKREISRAFPKRSTRQSANDQYLPIKDMRPESFSLTIRGPPLESRDGSSRYGDTLLEFAKNHPRQGPNKALHELADLQNKFPHFKYMQPRLRSSNRVILAVASLEIPSSRHTPKDAYIVFENTFQCPIMLPSDCWYTKTHGYLCHNGTPTVKDSKLHHAPCTVGGGKRILTCRVGEDMANYWSHACCKYWQLRSHANAFDNCYDYQRCIGHAEQYIRERASHLTALQEIHCNLPRGEADLPAMIILWKFEIVRAGEWSGLTWHNLLPSQEDYESDSNDEEEMTVDTDVDVLGPTAFLDYNPNTNFHLNGFDAMAGANSSFETLATGPAQSRTLSVPYMSQRSSFDEGSACSSQTAGRVDCIETPSNCGFSMPEMAYPIQTIDPELAPEPMHPYNVQGAMAGISAPSEDQLWLCQYTQPGAVASTNYGNAQSSHNGIEDRDREQLMEGFNYQANRQARCQQTPDLNSDLAQFYEPQSTFIPNQQPLSFLRSTPSHVGQAGNLHSEMQQCRDTQPTPQPQVVPSQREDAAFQPLSTPPEETPNASPLNQAELNNFYQLRAAFAQASPTESQQCFEPFEQSRVFENNHEPDQVSQSLPSQQQQPLPMLDPHNLTLASKHISEFEFDDMHQHPKFLQHNMYGPLPHTPPSSQTRSESSDSTPRSPVRQDEVNVREDINIMDDFPLPHIIVPSQPMHEGFAEPQKTQQTGLVMNDGDARIDISGERDTFRAVQEQMRCMQDERAESPTMQSQDSEGGMREANRDGRFALDTEEQQALVAAFDPNVFAGQIECGFGDDRGGQFKGENGNLSRCGVSQGGREDKGPPGLLPSPIEK